MNNTDCIGDFFSKDIFRTINGVIKVEDTKEDLVYNELSEYVITKETRKYLDVVFSAFQDEKIKESGNTGIWISGFFGSGKSHFLKMVSYILSNNGIKGTSPLTIISQKIDDEHALGCIERSVESPKDVILFNIDSKAQKSDSQDRLVELFMRVFNEHRGYSGQLLWVARLEEYLDSRNLYVPFKEEIYSLTGKSWESLRNDILFETDNVKQALVTVGFGSTEQVDQTLESIQTSEPLSIELFVDRIKTYLESKPPEHTIYFFIDEVGQFIGSNSQLMLNLQTIVEDIGIQLPGRVWIAVTSQAAIDAVTKDIHEMDFSKIQGRFNTRVTLTSSNADDVIKKRLLEKRKEFKDLLESYYAQKNVEINNLLSLVQSDSTKKAFADATEFAEIYPFVPYQFRLMQKILENIRLSGYTGKHLAQGERSLLSSFKEAAEHVADKKLGALVPLHLFYDTIESFLDPHIRKTIVQTQQDDSYTEMDVNVLKTLFLLKDLKELRANIDTLIALFASHDDDNKKAIRDKIVSSLEKLENHTLIHKSNDIYHFLTDEEQDITRRIKNFQVETHQLRDFVKEILFDDILKSIRKSYNEYPLRCGVNDRVDNVQNADLILKIITPDYHGAYTDDKQTSLNGSMVFNTDYDDTLLVRLNNTDTIVAAEMYLKLRSYLQTPSDAITPYEGKIRADKQREAYELRKKLVVSLREDLDNATYYVDKKEVALQYSGIENRIKEGLELLVRNVFKKKDHVEHPYGDSDVRKIIKENRLDATLTKNEAAQNDIMSYMGSISAHERMPFTDLLNHFSRKPYGWNKPSIILVILALKEKGHVVLYHQKEIIAEVSEALYNELFSNTKNSYYFLVPVQQTSKETIKEIMAYARELFEVSFTDSNERSVYEKVCDAIEKYYQRISLLKERYTNGRQYPGKQVFMELYQLIADIQSNKESFYFYFSELQKALPELQEKIEDVHKIEQFFTSKQVEIFDDMVSKKEYYKRNISYMDEDAKNAFKNIELILSKDDPYNEIHNLHTLKATVEASLSRALEKVRQDMISYLEEARTYLEEARMHKGESLPDVPSSEFENIKNIILSAEECIVVDSQKRIIDDIKREYIKSLEKNVPHEEKNVVIYVEQSFFSYPQPIEKKEDIESYLAYIRSKLEEKLREGHIRVI